MKFKGMKQAGFSLVELMVVVGIIGILAALAVPRLQTFTAKAKISEGRALVNNMATLQQAYYTENSVYFAFIENDTAANYANVGFSRPAVAGQFYRNPSVVIAANVFTTGAQTNLPLCSGVLATDARVTVTMNHNNTLGFGAIPAAGGVGASRSPVFTCN